MFGACFNGTPKLGASSSPSYLEQALVSLLNSSTSVTDEVGDRIRPDYRPESDDVPALCYEVLSDTRDHHLKGTSGTARARVRLAIIGEDRADCSATREAVKNLLDGYRGTVGSLFFIRIKHDDQADSSEDRGDDSDEFYHVQSLEFVIRYGIALPSHT